MLKRIFGSDYELLLHNQNELEKTLIIIEKTFRHNKDKQGMAYIGHLIRVSNKVSGSNEKIVALLHDIVEDTEVTLDDLREIGYSKEIVDAVDILTHRKGFTHDQYIDKVIGSNNQLAIKVKKADVEDNKDENRLSELEEETQKRLKERYKIAYKKICDYLNEEEERHVRY